MDAFFLFKRAAGAAVQPFGIVFFLLALGLALAIFTKRRKNAITAIALAAALLFACSFPPLVRWQAWPLERLYAPYSGAADYRAVVVLGNLVAHPGDKNLPALSRLGDSARARLAEGVRLWRLRPEAELLTSGYDSMDLENCADAMAAAAVELGVPAEKVRSVPQGLDTRHEAALAAEIVGGGKTLVVTTAVHMPRAMAYFREAGVNAAAAPCDFSGPVDGAVRSGVNGRLLRPMGSGLTDSQEIWHEAAGILYLWLSTGVNALAGENRD